MNILMASDENYVFLLGVSLYSILDTNKKQENINVYIIADDISKDSQGKLYGLAEKYNRKIYFLKPPALSSQIIVKGTLNTSTYYRLKMASILPDSVEKVLYLDCDTLIRGDLSELWSVDIEESLLAGVTDTTGKQARSSIGLSTESHYVNAGVLLVNLKRWREENIEQRMFDYLVSQKYNVEFNDQGVINHVCSKKTHLVGPEYNFMMPYERYSRRQLLRITQRKKFYEDEQIELAKDGPKIIHFAGYAFNRPWFYGAKGKYVNEFLLKMDESGFETKLKEQPQNYKFRMRKFAGSMPDELCISANQVIDFMYRVSVKLENLRSKFC